MHLIDNRYELLEVIASGGMATVWRARDTRLGRLVAVKRPHPRPPGDDLADSMGREARAAASLSHPNLITVYDFGRDESGPFLVMELIEGPTLQEVSGAVDEPEAVDIGAQVAEGLAAIHAAGIVHRDVKPANVIMSPRGPLLTDFGIASVPDATLKLTGPGEVVTTPAYAAPEVLAGGEPSTASDVYSLAATVDQVIRASGSDPDPAVGAFLAAALSESPDDRPDAAGFAAGLRRNAPAGTAASPSDPTLVMGSSVSPTPPPKAEPDGARRSPAPALVAAGLLAVLALALTLLGLTQDDPVPTAGAAQPVVSTTAAVAASTSRAPTTTVAPTTTTVPPTTTTTTFEDPVLTTRNQLESHLLEPPRSDMSPAEVREVMRRVDEAIAATADGDEREAEEDLADALATVEEEMDDEARAEAIALIFALADQLGIEIDPDDDDEDDRDD